MQAGILPVGSLWLSKWWHIMSERTVIGWEGQQTLASHAVGSTYFQTAKQCCCGPTRANYAAVVNVLSFTDLPKFMDVDRNALSADKSENTRSKQHQSKATSLLCLCAERNWLYLKGETEKLLMSGQDHLINPIIFATTNKISAWWFLHVVATVLCKEHLFNINVLWGHSTWDYV